MSHRDQPVLLLSHIKMSRREEEKLFCVVSFELATKTLLKSFAGEIHRFTDLNELIEFLHSTRHEQVLLIVADGLPEKILTKVKSFRHVREVFPLKPSAEKSDEDELQAALEQRIAELQKENFSFSIFEQDQRTSQDVSNESNRFLWYQVLFHLLRRMPADDAAKEEMLKLYSKFYQNGSQEQRLIEEYRRTGDVERAIHWYTRNTFFFRLANRALRSEDLFLVYHLRYWIKQLDLAIGFEHEKQKRDEIWTLFSGFQLHRDELERLKKSLGQIISINSFLSTSRSVEVAQIFSGCGPIEDPLVRVLFQIDANPLRLQSVRFADVRSFSQFNEEREVLFSFGSTFRLVSIEGSIVRLEATDDGSERIRNYCQLADEHLRSISPKLYFGQILNENLGQADRAAKYFRELIRFLGDKHPDAPEVYRALGDAYVQQKDMSRALKCYRIQEKATKNQKRIRQILEENLAKEEAKSEEMNLVKALLLVELADFLNSTEAEIYLARALKFYEDSNLASPAMSQCLEELARVRQRAYKHQQALDAQFRCYEIEEEYLPIENPKLGETLKTLFFELNSPDDFRRFIDFCETRLPILTAKLGEEHRRVIQMENYLIEIEEKLEDFEEDLEKWEKRERELPTETDENKLGKSYEDLSFFYSRYGFYEKSLQLCVAALQIVRNPDKILGFYDQMTRCCQHLRNFELEFAYLVEAYHYAESIKGADSQLTKSYRERVDNLCHIASRQGIVLPWTPLTSAPADLFW